MRASCGRERLYTNPPRGSGRGYADFDQPESADDKWAAAQSTGPSSKPRGDGALLLVCEPQPGAPTEGRVRVRRAEMGEGVVIKEMSEAFLLEKLERDLSQLDRARGC